jgi:hypothetical protein
MLARVCGFFIKLLGIMSNYTSRVYVKSSASLYTPNFVGILVYMLPIRSL